MLLKVVFFVFLATAFPVASLFAAPSVIVSTAPIHSVVSAVMTGAGEPDLLLPPTVSVHDFYLKPSDLRRLASADIIFWGGPALESGLVKILQSVGKEKQSVAVLADPRLIVYPARGDHHHDEPDGHFWLEPENMVVLAEIVAEKLSASDPENAALYEQNARRVRTDMRALKEEGKQKLKKVKSKPYVVFHDAFQYFEKSFDLFALGALFVDPHHAAGAARIADVREKIKRAGTVCLFAEPQFSDKRLKAAAEELPVIFGKLDPAGSALTPGRDFYPQLMRGLFHSLVECLSRLPEE